MTKRYNPEVVEIGGTRIQTRPTKDEYGEYVKGDQYDLLVQIARECVLDLDHSGSHPLIKRKLEGVLSVLGEEI